MLSNMQSAQSDSINQSNATNQQAIKGIFDRLAMLLDSAKDRKQRDMINKRNEALAMLDITDRSVGRVSDQIFNAALANKQNKAEEDRFTRGLTQQQTQFEAGQKLDREQLAQQKALTEQSFNENKRQFDIDLQERKRHTKVLEGQAERGEGREEKRLMLEQYRAVTDTLEKLRADTRANKELSLAEQNQRYNVLRSIGSGELDPSDPYTLQELEKSFGPDVTPAFIDSTGIVPNPTESGIDYLRSYAPKLKGKARAELEAKIADFDLEQERIKIAGQRESTKTDEEKLQFDQKENDLSVLSSYETIGSKERDAALPAMIASGQRLTESGYKLSGDQVNMINSGKQRLGNLAMKRLVDLDPTDTEIDFPSEVQGVFDQLKTSSMNHDQKVKYGEVIQGDMMKKYGLQRGNVFSAPLDESRIAGIEALNKFRESNSDIFGKTKLIPILDIGPTGKSISIKSFMPSDDPVDWERWQEELKKIKKFRE